MCGARANRNLPAWIGLGVVCIAAALVVAKLYWPAPVMAEPSNTSASTAIVSSLEPPSVDAVKPIIDEAMNNYNYEDASIIEENGKAIGIKLEDALHERPEETPLPKASDEISLEDFANLISINDYNNDTSRIYDKTESILTSYFAGFNPPVGEATKMKVLAEIRKAVEERASYINEDDEFLVTINVDGTVLYISVVYSGE